MQTFRSVKVVLDCYRTREEISILQRWALQKGNKEYEVDLFDYLVLETTTLMIRLDLIC